MSDSTKKTETFILNIYNRQNATWQGSVTWVERKEKQQAEVQSEKEAKDDAVFSEIEQDFGVKEWEGEI